MTTTETEHDETTQPGEDPTSTPEVGSQARLNRLLGGGPDDPNRKSVPGDWFTLHFAQRDDDGEPHISMNDEDMPLGTVITALEYTLEQLKHRAELAAEIRADIAKANAAVQAEVEAGREDTATLTGMLSMLGSLGDTITDHIAKHRKDDETEKKDETDAPADDAADATGD